MYLRGAYNSEESRRHYKEICQEIALHKIQTNFEFQAPARRSPVVNDVVYDFLRFAESHYGRKSNEFYCFRSALTPITKLYGKTRINKFGPLALQDCQRWMVKEGWTRKTVNSQVNRIRRMFKWAVSQEKIETEVLVALQTVAPLRKGRTDAKERPKVMPAKLADVKRVVPFVAPVVADMIRFQWLTGARSDEITAIRLCDLDRSGDVWIYHKLEHKTAHFGKEKIIAIGPRAQKILAKYIDESKPEKFLFDPQLAVVQMAERKIKTPGQKPKTRQRIRERYDAASYQHAINHGFIALLRSLGVTANRPKGFPMRDWVEKHGVTYWHPHQLRHTRGTKTRARYGVEGAQAQLGNTLEATEIYAEKSIKLARKIARQTG